ncbi:MAG: AAA family ATPase [Treponema sp.]|jgi:MoxR-like ATPase|nr:AAA family ATPase [Treponema sp.]
MEQKKSIARLLDGAETVIRGKRPFLEYLCAGALAGGHILLEDLPGLGKTTVAKTFAHLIAGPRKKPLLFKRIQFTPDLLPYDITGVDVFDPQKRAFRFVPGPVLSNIVLADEINRTTPKVQSALLEVMAEGQVTIGQNTYQPPAPFLVIATENPVESEGTFPLPAAQLDRFMLRLSLGYPDRAAELGILEDNPGETALAALKPVLDVKDFLALKAAASRVFCHQALKEAIADIVRDTRANRAFSLGASPRAALHLLGAARGLALVRGRAFVSDADIADLIIPCLLHRVRFRDPRAEGEKLLRGISASRLEKVNG